jgi:DNA-directed RNA polymerase subunit RPC12/RpoP
MDKNYIKNCVQDVLNKEFKSIHKRKINEFADRLNIACCYCGDSKSEYKKRGNLYFNKLLYICFNCGKKTNFDKFTKDFGLRLDPSKKLEIIEHLNSQISFKDAEEDLMETELNKLLDFTDLERIFNSGDNIITDFEPIQKNTGLFQYLINRGIPPQLHQNIWGAKYWINDEKYEPVLVLLNKKGNKIIGCQIRNLKDGKRRLFKIYNYETLYKWIYNVEEITDIDANQLVIYNKLSYYFNILNVDFSEKITVFEGYLDSLFYPNSIGVVGVNTDMKFLENNQLDLQYFYDNDAAGYQKSEEKIKDGYPIFLWKKLFESIVDKKNSQDPYGLMYRISKVKDLNKLAELSLNPYKKFELNKFFSKDLMDLRWLPKKEKKKFNRVKI